MGDINLKIELPKVVNKTLEKPASTLGDKISDLLEIIFGNITYKKNELEYKRQLNFEKFKKELEYKISLIPDEEKVDAKENIIGPALEAIKYRISEEEIRTMFANLISSSVNRKNENVVHPAFIEILKNLSCDDANAITNMALLKDSALMPIVSLNEEIITVPNNSRHYCCFVDNFGFEKSNIVISSLLRNGLIQIDYTNVLKNELFDYTNMIKEFKKLRNFNNSDENYRVGILSLTAFGYEFAKVCCPKTINEVWEIKKFLSEN